MAKLKAVYSEDATTLIFKGNKANPEPSTGVIKFPGGNVEVSRTSDGSYWVHVDVEDSINFETKDSRVEYSYERGNELTRDGKKAIPPLPHAEDIEHIALRIYPRVVAVTGE